MEMRFEVASFDEGYELVGKYVSNWAKIYPERNADAESVQAYKRREEYGRGFRSALAECFEVYIAASRVARYGLRSASIPVPPAFEIEMNLFPAIDGAWLEASKAHKGSKGEMITFFWEVFTPILQLYMFASNLDEQDESFRRQHVLNGTEEPEPDDDKWLDEEAAELEKRAADIRKRFDIK